MILIQCNRSPFHKGQHQFRSHLFKLVMGQSFLGRRARPVRKTDGAQLEKLDEFGNTVQPRRSHGQSRNARVKSKRDVAKDVDTDVDDSDNFVSGSSSDVGSSDLEDFDACDPIRWWVSRRAQVPNLYCLACDI